jgi:hypothetical protein
MTTKPEHTEPQKEAAIMTPTDVKPETTITIAPEYVPEVPAVSESAAIMGVIERAARDPNVDIDKMERLMAMRERLLEREAQMEFNAAMAAAQAEMEPVARDARNTQTNSDYARLEAIARAITPIITKHGFATTFGTADCPKEGHYRVTCTCTHRAGYSKDYHADIPADTTGIKGTVNKTKTHAFGSTMSYGRRYLKLLVFDIATEDDDGNAAGGAEPINDDQLHALSEKIDEVGADIAAFCKYLQVPALKELPNSKFESAMRELEIFGQRKAKSHA